MGWPPRYVKPCSLARAKHASHTGRFTPQQSSTTGPGPMWGAKERRQSTAARGGTAMSTRSQEETFSSVRGPAAVPLITAKSKITLSRSRASTSCPASA